jgi:hypothetical protein
MNWGTGYLKLTMVVTGKCWKFVCLCTHMWLSFWYHFSSTSKLLIRGSDPNIYNCNVCNGYLKSHFLSVFERQTVKQRVHSSCSVLCLLRTHCTSFNSVRPKWHLHPQFSCSECSLVEDLRCPQWWGFVTLSRLGQPIFWYMVVP